LHGLLKDLDLGAAIVKAVDERRLALFGSLFAEMGFKVWDAELRARSRRLSKI
jgi:hypothetical protein